jgi:hypothetical protein
VKFRSSGVQELREFRTDESIGMLLQFCDPERLDQARLGMGDASDGGKQMFIHLALHRLDSK